VGGGGGDEGGDVEVVALAEKGGPVGPTDLRAGFGISNDNWVSAMSGMKIG
jgi:hypothetical protein